MIKLLDQATAGEEKAGGRKAPAVGMDREVHDAVAVLVQRKQEFAMGAQVEDRPGV